jgi:hypothetical protein
MKTIHTFRIVDESDDESDYQSEGIFPEVDMKICSEASIDDMLNAFQSFLHAVGYVTLDNSYLDFVKEPMLPIEEYEGEF